MTMKRTNIMYRTSLRKVKTIFEHLPDIISLGRLY